MRNIISKFLFTLLALSLGFGQVWAADVTFSAAEIAAGTAKGNIAVYGPTGTSNSKICTSSNVALVQVSNAADGTYTDNTKRIAFAVQNNAGTITSITIHGSTNSSTTDATSNGPVIYWDNTSFPTTAIGYDDVMFKSYIQTNSCDGHYYTITPPSGTKAFAVYKRVKFNTTSFALGNSESTYGGNTTLRIDEVTITLTPSCDGANASIIADQSIYVNDDLDLQFSSDNTNSVSYSIKKGGVATSDASVTAGVFNATVAGTYVVTATQAADASNHCAVEESVTITVNAKTPVASVSITGDATAFIGMAKTLTANADQAVSEYKWEVDGVDQGVDAATFNFSAAAAGTYSVVCQARNSFNDPGEYISSSAHEIVVTKICGELIRATRNGKNLDPVTGVIGGTATKNTQDGGKLGSSGHYWKLVLASGNFMIGDVVTVNVSTAAGQGTLAITTDQAGTDVVATAGGVGVVGDNELTITEAVGNTIWLSRDGTNNTWNGVVDAIYVTRSCAISDDCSIKSLTINGETVTPSAKVYSYEVASASALTEVAVAYTIHPLATGTPASGFNVTVPAAGDPANTQTITVTAEDGTTSDTYTVSVTKASAASDVVTLNDLGVTGYTLDPTFDAGTLAYTITKAYGAEDPGTDKVTYIKSEVAQTVEVTYDGTNHKFVVTVTAEDNTTTQDYEITINEAEAPKNLSRVLFSNGFDAFIDNTNHTVKAYYLAGQSAPTATTITAGAGTAGEYAAGKITVTGADASTVDYIVNLEAVTPNTTTVAAEAAAGEFAGDEAWVKNGLLIYGNPAGFSAGDKWYVNRRLLKSGDAADDQRIIAGWVRSYFFVGNAYKFIMTVGGNKALKYAIDGGTPVDANTETLEITLTAGNHMIEIVSNQSSGDCRLLAPKLVEMPTLYEVTYDAGEGSVKGGEVIPTQAATMEGGKFDLASGDVLEKSGYDFTGWLCSADAVVYAAGAEYTMTAAATTFTAQWTLHVVPVDPTLTYDNGAYTIGATALDLSTLQTASESTGAITYSVKDAGTTGATVDGNNFTATAAGTAIITASQAAVVGYNAKDVDFNVVVTEATEIDGIKLVEAGALTGNYITARTLSNGDNTVEGIAYTKYLTMSSTMTSFGNEVAPSATKGIYYYPSHKNIRFYFYVYNNQSSAKKIYIYTVDEDAESTSDATSANVSVDAGRHMVYADVVLTKHAAVVFGVENTGTQICQIVAVESGDVLLQGGEIGYTINYNKCYISPKANTVAVYDGIEYKLSNDAKLVSAGNVQLTTLGTHYIKFHLDNPAQVKVYADNHTYYIGSECSTSDEAKLYEASGDGEFALAAGDWYINGSGTTVKINKLEFSAPKCAEPAFNALANSDICSGDPYVALNGTATVADAGVPTYQWYKEDNTPIDGATNAEYTPTEDGKYYVIAINHLAGFSDNEKKSGLVTVATVAGTVINEGPANVRDDAGESATLTVDASGKDLHYAWKECATIDGSYTDVAGAADAASLEVTVPTGVKYYKVVVSSACGADAEAIAKVEEWVELPQLEVSENTVWDWTNAGENNKLSAGKNVEIVMANIRENDKMPTNDATFKSQALLFYGENVRAVEGGNAYASIGHIKFTTTVDGFVKVRFADNGTNNRCVRISGGAEEEFSEPSASKTDIKEFTAFVPAGEVEIMGVKEDHTGSNAYIRIFRIEFAKVDYHRAATSGRIGTICLPNGGVMKEGAVFEVAYYGQTSQKVFFDEVVGGVMEAGIPYIFMPNEGTKYIGVEYTDAANAAATNHNGLYGFIGASATDEYNIPDGVGNYIIQNNQYREVQAGADARIVSNRAYLKLGDITPTEPALAPGRRRISMGKDETNVATGLEDLEVGETPMKVMMNGQLFILRGDKIYDATGRLMK